MAMIGDAVQYADEEGDWYHTVIISAIENGEIYVCAQSDDALDRPISSYNFATARFLHIEGVRFEVDDTDCFNYLISGGETSLVPNDPDLPDLQPTPPSPTPNEPSPENDRPNVVEGS